MWGCPFRDGAELVSDTVRKAELLLRQFQSVFTKEGVDLPSALPRRYPEVEQITVVVAGVAKLLKNIKPGKASGPDALPNVVLKNCADAIAPVLTCIFQRSLDTASLPADWHTANVSCIYKKEDKHNPANYRPVSLTSVVCKTLEHIIHRHIMLHLEQHGILSTLNHRFRSGYSCETQLLTTFNDLSMSFDKGHQVDVTVLDFSKAFDTIPHKKLLFKLASYGIGGQLHGWLSVLLMERTMKVILDGECSSEVTVESGVPQGTVLGLLLFLCHINDIADGLSSTIRLFADDCLLYRVINSIQDQKALQEDLKRLELWAERWGMSFNASKCKILIVKGKLPYFYTIHDTILEQITNSPYLGLDIADDLKWDRHISKITKKANSTLGFLRRNLRGFHEDQKRMSYIALVRSVLEYGSVVWDPYTRGNIDRLERANGVQPDSW